MSVSESWILPDFNIQMLNLRHFAPVPLRSSSDEHLHEVDEGKENAKRHHAQEQQFLVAAELADVREDIFQSITVVLILLVEFFFDVLDNKKKVIIHAIKTELSS